MSAADSGLSLLEILLVLVLLASLSTLAMISTRSPQPPAGADQLVRFLAERRADAILTGKPTEIRIADGDARSGQKSTTWSGQLRSDSRATTLPHSLLAFPDGSYSGALLSLSVEDIERELSGTYRGLP